MTSLLALTLPIANPTWIFFVVLLIILLAPLLFEGRHDIGRYRRGPSWLGLIDA